MGASGKRAKPLRNHVAMTIIIMPCNNARNSKRGLEEDNILHYTQVSQVFTPLRVRECADGRYNEEAADRTVR